MMDYFLIISVFLLGGLIGYSAYVILKVLVLVGGALDTIIDKLAEIEKRL